MYVRVEDCCEVALDPASESEDTGLADPGEVAAALVNETMPLAIVLTDDKVAEYVLSDSPRVRGPV